MRRAELSLRKELALTRLRIARMELALAGAHDADRHGTATAAIDLASSLLAGRSLGKWARYARMVLGVVRVVLRLRPGRAAVAKRPGVPLRRGEDVPLAS